MAVTIESITNMLIFSSDKTRLTCQIFTNTSAGFLRTSLPCTADKQYTVTDTTVMSQYRAFAIVTFLGYQAIKNGMYTDPRTQRKCQKTFFF